MNERALNTVVFLGPSLKWLEAEGLLQARYLPPARQSDILFAARFPDVREIVLIDGEFGQSLSVWHKEILFAISRGIRVWGASSMGALRAAELHQYGMRGYGRIYEDYRNGRITGDDEVALVYGPQELEYYNITVPLINIRYTLSCARLNGVITSGTEEACLAMARDQFFQDRTLEVLLAGLANLVIPPDELAKLRDVLTSRYIDQKREDAIGMLASLECTAEPNLEKVENFYFNKSDGFQVQSTQDLRIERRGKQTSLRQLAKYVAIHHSDFQQVMLNASNRALVQILARIVGLTPSASEVEAEIKRLRLHHSLIEEDAYLSWLKINDLTVEEFTDLAKRLAVCRLMYRWMLDLQGRKENTKLLLDELRIQNNYSEWADAACCHFGLLANVAPEQRIVTEEGSAHELFRDHLSQTEWDIDVDCEVWASEAGYRSVDELIEDLADCRALRKFLKGLVSQVAEALR